MNVIKMELLHLELLKHTASVAACTVCSIYVHFNISCRHIIPQFEPIPLHMIPASWRLSLERTVSAFAEATQCSLNQPDANSIDVIRSEASKCFYEIEEKMAALKGLSQASTIWEKLKKLKEDVNTNTINLTNLLPPFNKSQINKKRAYKTRVCWKGTKKRKRKRKPRMITKKSAVFSFVIVRRQLSRFFKTKSRVLLN